MTIWPSVKWMPSRYPETRARTSTVSSATNRPTYSSWSTTLRFIGAATVTFGGGGAPRCCGASLQAASATGIANNSARPGLTVRMKSP